MIMVVVIMMVMTMMTLMIIMVKDGDNLVVMAVIIMI